MDHEFFKIKIPLQISIEQLTKAPTSQFYPKTQGNEDQLLSLISAIKVRKNKKAEKELLKAEIKKISEQQTTVLVAPEEIKEKVSPEKLTVEYNSSQQEEKKEIQQKLGFAAAMKAALLSKIKVVPNDEEVKTQERKTTSIS